MKKILFPILLIAILSACKSDPETMESNPAGSTSPTAIDTPVQDERNVEILFDESTFDNPKIPVLLKELNLCDAKQTNLKDARNPACDPKFFKVLPYAENEQLENAFLVVVRAGVHDWPLRRVMVYQREQGKLVIVNTFIANLVGTKKSATKHDDLILQFLDEYENRLECVYKWKENRYQYASVERIEGGKIKKTLQDSMNVEIAKVITANKMAF